MVDATGVGAGLTSFLSKACGAERVLRKYVLDAKQVTIEYAQEDGAKAKGKS